MITNLHCERLDGALPLIVYLHHGLGSVAQWRDFPQRVGHAALLYDREGHGRSPSATDLRQPDYLLRQAEVLCDLLADLDDFILFGHSDGASIALLYPSVAGRQPRAIISEAAHLFVEDETRRGIRATIDRPELLPRLRKYHGDKTGKLVWDWAGTWLAPSFDGLDLRERVRAVLCPVLAMQGDQDEYGTMAQLQAIEKACSGPVRPVVLNGCGHEPHSQAPEMVAETVLDFLSAIG